MNVTPVAWIAMVSAISDRPQVQLSNKAVLVAPIDARFKVVGHGGVDWITLTPRRCERPSELRSASSVTRTLPAVDAQDLAGYEGGQFEVHDRADNV